MVKRINKTRLGVAIGILVVILVTLLVAFWPRQAVEEETIKIGAILPLSGSKAIAGEQGRDGLLLAEIEINRAGGVNGKKIELQIEDSLGTSQGAVTAMQKLVNVDNLQVIIGGYLSVEAVPLIPIAQENKVILFSPTATTSELVDAGEYVFKMREGNDVHAQKIIEVMQELNISSLAIIYNDNEYCKDVYEFFEEEIAKTTIETVATEKYLPDDTDYRTQLAKIRSVNPEGVYACGYYKDLGLVLKQARELGFDQQFFSVTTFQHPKLIEIAGEAVEDVIYTVSPLDCETTAKEFCENLEKEGFKTGPSYRSAYLYDALKIIAEAIEKAEDDDPEKVKVTLLEVDFDGATGKTAFDEKGNSIKDVIVKKVENGQFVAYESST